MEDVKKEKVCRRLKTIDAISRQEINIRVGMVQRVVSIVFDSLELHIFISELLDYLLPIKMVSGGGGEGGGTVPWGRPHWIGINFCHPEVVKFQQQCYMQNTIFDLPHNWFYSFFSVREGEC